MGDSGPGAALPKAETLRTPTLAHVIHAVMTAVGERTNRPVRVTELDFHPPEGAAGSYRYLGNDGGLLNLSLSHAGALLHVLREDHLRGRTVVTTVASGGSTVVTRKQEPPTETTIQRAVEDATHAVGVIEHEVFHATGASSEAAFMRACLEISQTTPGQEAFLEAVIDTARLETQSDVLRRSSEILVGQGFKPLPADMPNIRPLENRLAQTAAMGRILDDLGFKRGSRERQDFAVAMARESGGSVSRAMLAREIITRSDLGAGEFWRVQTAIAETFDQVAKVDQEMRKEHPEVKRQAAIKAGTSLRHRITELRRQTSQHQTQHRAVG